MKKVKKNCDVDADDDGRGKKVLTPLRWERHLQIKYVTKHNRVKRFSWSYAAAQQARPYFGVIT